MKTKCDICTRMFDVIEEHHVVPQSCGGRDGPTVNLCGAHHSLIHVTADTICRDYKAGHRKINIDTYRWTGDDMPHWDRGKPLVQAIVRAQLDPNRHENSRHNLRLDLSHAEIDMVKRLKVVLGVSSQDKVLRTALVQLAKAYGIKPQPTPRAPGRR